jgi:hypothetical protein
VETQGQTLDALWTEPRAQEAARRCLTSALRRPNVPENSPLDGSAAQEAAIKGDHAAYGPTSAIRTIP